MIRPFGELEAEIMRVVWQSEEPLTARSLTDRLAEQRPLAVTTVMTITERLREKGWLTRAKDGRSFRYSAARSADDYTADLMSRALEASTDPANALARFAGRLSSQEAAALREALNQSPPDSAATDRR
ncbi:BlaI/MecI/CopY family transcriptional regulator [Streptomyces sp. CdTB01]|uniref:BlaI/MecI/CopY family transcriptional regulator n=1 Tax=Streptomyces sp. CdTB01 TaxID=1725411 RepID=UPI0007C8044E